MTPRPPGRMRAGFASRARLRRRAGLVHGSMMVGGMERTFCAAVSSRVGAPLLVALHGAGSTGAGTAALTGLAERGPAAGCTVVFPDGRGRVWNDERAAPSIARRSLVDDVGFIQKLVEHILREHSGDGAAVYATGISNGALMSEHLARHSLVDLAGIALVAGTAAVTSRERAPTPLRAVQVLMFEGTADPLIPYGGGPIGPLGRLAARRAARTGRQPGRGVAVPAEQVAADWAAAASASPVPRVDRSEPPGDLPVTRLAWVSAAARRGRSLPHRGRGPHVARRSAVPAGFDHRPCGARPRCHGDHPRSGVRGRFVTQRRFVNVAEARRHARRVLPRVVFDYVDGGAEDEVTMAANVAAFRDIAFRPRMAVGALEPSLSVEIFGESLSLPVILAPCGLARLMHPDGPAGATRAAASRGTVSVLSTVAGAALEDVAAASNGPMWFQLYAAGGRSEAESLIGRAASSGFRALVVTVDTPVLGHRERDVRHGVEPPLRITSRGVVHLGPQVLSKPVWAWRMAREGVRMFSSRGAAKGGPGRGAAKGGHGRGAAPLAPKGGPGRGAAPTAPSVVSVSSIASPFRWSDIEWMRGIWQGPLLVKGVLTPEDAMRAVACGSDGVIVSNHGGRQLEGAPATLRVLPDVVEAVGDEIEVLVDGGVRRGSDVVKAVALGAARRSHREALSLRARRGRPAGRGAGARHLPGRDGKDPVPARLPRRRGTGPELASTFQVRIGPPAARGARSLN